MNISVLGSCLPSYDHCTRICSECLKLLVLHSGVVAVAVVAIAIVLLMAIDKWHYAFERIANKALFPAFCAVWLLAFVVYDVGAYTGEPAAIWGNAPMAVIHAFAAFLLQSDVSAIQDPFHNNWFFMMWFSLAHFAAAVVSMVFVIKHFGFNVIASIKMRYASRFLASSKSSTFLFWGLNDASYYLAKSINEHYEQAGNRDYRIIVVRTNNDSDEFSKKNGMERMLNFISLRNKDFDRLQELRCLTTSTYSDLSKLALGKGTDAPRTDILGNSMRLRALRRIIRNKTSKDLHIFFLTEDQRYNIVATTKLKLDETIINCAQSDGHSVKFYCHARYNSINRVVEDLDSTTNIDVRIIDSSHMAIESLKKEASCQPINFVDIDKAGNPGTVTSAFTSLIVGFGEVGKDALRFLYEFGAFVDSSSADHEALRSQFNCHVVDKNFGAMSGPFINGLPNLFTNRNPLDNSALVALHALDCNSDEFYNTLLDELSQKLNYIIIAVGEDEAGITLAVRILRFLRRKGRDFARLRIFVRCYDASLHTYMKRIADHYNGNEERIVVFGCDSSDIYTYSMIIDEEVERKGRMHYDSYRSLNPDNDTDGSWEQRRKKLKGQIPNHARLSLESLQKLSRKETQDKANALHELTILHIVEAVYPNWLTELVPNLFEQVTVDGQAITKVRRNHAFEGGQSRIEYPLLTRKQQALMQNLAKLEHIRWIASHEVLGYTVMPDTVPDNSRGCDESLMIHNCLIPWEKLDRETCRVDYVNDYKLFDYGVIETTLDILRRKLEIEHETTCKSRE